MAIISITLTAFSVKGIMKSDGSPPYNTNAPGEKTCSDVDCHSGGIADNAGLGAKSITFSGGTQYLPGQTYTITVTVSHPSRNRFGFQIVSLLNSNANAGIVTITDAARTRNEIPNFGAYQTRNYVTHVLNGSTGIANSCSWSYNWTAPPTDQGPVTFYACMLAANNNSINDKGDETYYTQLTINPASSSTASQKAEDNEMIVYPNPATNNLTISFTLNEASPFKAELMDTQGKLVQVLYRKEYAVGTVTKSITLASGIKHGIYLVRITTDKGESSKRIIIQD